MLTHRISCDADIKTNIDFKKAWELICSNEKVWFGNKQRNNCSIFEYITKSTLFRPRDYIRYIQVCAENTVERKIDRIRAHTVKYVDRAFSNYIKEEFIDELFPIIPEIETVFDILSNQRKWNIKVKDFITVYNTYLKSGAIQEGNIEKLLDTLFNFSVIGNQHPKRIDVQYFKYIQTNMKFNKNENIVIHRGLFKSLGII